MSVFMQYRMLVLDIDDTLLGSDRKISEKNFAAIRRAQRAGIFVTLATGRGYFGASRIWKQLQVRGPVICYGGALIMNTLTHQPLHQAEISGELVTEALLFAKECGLHVQLYQNDTVVFAQENAFTERYVNYLTLPYRVEPDLFDLSWQQVPKVLVFAPPEEEDEVRAIFSRRFAGKLEVACSKPGFIELNRLGTHKGSALRYVANMLQIPLEQVAAMGDNTLDSEMIMTAGLGACVGNAYPEVKEIACVIAPSCNDDAVAWLIEKYLL